MGSKNDYIKQRQERDRQMIANGISLGMQLTSDFFQIALRDPEVMGKDTFGRTRIEKIVAKTMELDDFEKGRQLAFTEMYDIIKTRHKVILEVLD